jgi:hypothetical protein
MTNMHVMRNMRSHVKHVVFEVLEKTSIALTLARPVLAKLYSTALSVESRICKFHRNQMMLSVPFKDNYRDKWVQYKPVTSNNSTKENVFLFSSFEESCKPKKTIIINEVLFKVIETFELKRVYSIEIADLPNKMEI